MDPGLPLERLCPRLPLEEPFTPAVARRAGVDRRELERALACGSLRRVLRGVYAASTAADGPELRRRALALAVHPGSVVVDRTAAWAHGVRLAALDPLGGVDTMASTGRDGRARAVRRLLARDLEVHGPLRLTSPLRTALDVGRLLPPDDAQAVLDDLLHRSLVGHPALLAELPRMAGLRGAAQLRGIAAQADGRASSPAESVLRRRWTSARLPTAVPGLLVPAGGRLLRLTLGVERCRFGAVLAGGLGADDLAALQPTGWRVVVLPAERVRCGDPELLRHHLEREFHQHLLADLA